MKVDPATGILVSGGTGQTAPMREKRTSIAPMQSWSSSTNLVCLFTSSAAPCSHGSQAIIFLCTCAMSFSVCLPFCFRCNPEECSARTPRLYFCWRCWHCWRFSRSVAQAGSPTPPLSTRYPPIFHFKPRELPPETWRTQVLQLCLTFVFSVDADRESYSVRQKEYIHNVFLFGIYWHVT